MLAFVWGIENFMLSSLGCDVVKIPTHVAERLKRI